MLIETSLKNLWGFVGETVFHGPELLALLALTHDASEQVMASRSEQASRRAPPSRGEQVNGSNDSERRRMRDV